MPKQQLIPFPAEQDLPDEAADVAQGVGIQLATFLFPWLVALDRLLDQRWGRTFLSSIHLILPFGDRVHGLLLSERAGFLLWAEHERAGTKRLAHLWHSPKCSSWLIDQFLWQLATGFVKQLEQQEQPSSAIWDERVWEKAESLAMDDLGPVRSSKAHRLTHSKPGSSRPPSRPIFVPGLKWWGLILVGPKAVWGAPVLAAMRWGSSRGLHAEKKRKWEAGVLLEWVAAWGRAVIHVFDRGFAGSPWLRLGFALQHHLVVRWPHGQQLLDERAQARKAWQIARGKRPGDRRRSWNAPLTRHLATAVLAFPVRHPEFAVPLFLGGSRQGKGRRPWSLLTTEPVQTPEQACKIVLAYARRWDSEGTWRFSQSELGVACPRLREGEPCRKLLLLVTLAQAFLLTLLQEKARPVRMWLLRHFCHRTGKQARQARLPRSRLPLALSRFWSAHPPHFALLALPGLAEGKRCSASNEKMAGLLLDARG